MRNKNFGEKNSKYIIFHHRNRYNMGTLGLYAGRPLQPNDNRCPYQKTSPNDDVTPRNGT